MASRRRLVERFTFASRAVHHHRLRRCPTLEVLEGRVVLSTFTVNSLGDAGSGSGDSGDLRYCINQANADNQANTIVFEWMKALRRSCRRAFSLRRRVLGRRGSGHRAGWYIWSTDAAATPSSVATASTACWATLRSTRPSEVKYGPM
jgi:hypothetical protein